MSSGFKLITYAIYKQKFSKDKNNTGFTDEVLGVFMYAMHI
jgi:hypothetical protein